jgi:predicted HTH domain antitoxin
VVSQVSEGGAARELEGRRAGWPAQESLDLLAAAKLYELGRLSSGKAARLAEMNRVSFLRELERVGVSAINLQGEEIEAEIRAAEELAG